MSEELPEDVWYVVYDGQPDDLADGEHVDPFPVAYPGSMESEARDTFKDNIEKGFAERNRGMFLVKLTGVKESQEDELVEVDSLTQVVLNGFQGYKSEVVDTYGVELNDWIEEATTSDGKMPEGAVETENGWVFEEVNPNPYTGV